MRLCGSRASNLRQQSRRFAATTEGYRRAEGFIDPPLPRPLRRRAPRLWYNNLTALAKSKILAPERTLYYNFFIPDRNEGGQLPSAAAQSAATMV